MLNTVMIQRFDYVIPLWEHKKKKKESELRNVGHIEWRYELIMSMELCGNNKNNSNDLQVQVSAPMLNDPHWSSQRSSMLDSISKNIL